MAKRNLLVSLSRMRDHAREAIAFARGRSVCGRKWGTAIRFSLAEPHCFPHESEARIGGCTLFSRSRTCVTG